jgi:hypothetical protein
MRKIKERGGHKERKTINKNKEQEFLGRTNRLLSFDTTRATQKTKNLSGRQSKVIDFKPPLISLIRKVG